MAVFSERMTAFVSSRISYLKNLKSQTEQQQMFVELGRKFLNGEELSASELRGLKTLATAEKAAEKAAEATRAARKLVSEKNEKARKERTRNMINAAGLMGLALDKDFANNGYVYVAYTYTTASGDLQNRLVRLREA